MLSTHNSSVDLAKDLFDFLDQEEENSVMSSDNTDKIHDKEAANYYIRKVKELQQEIQDINDVAEAEKEKQIERINQWAQSSTSSLKYMLDKYMAMLRDFWVEQGNEKTMKLSQGSLCMRKMRDKTEIDEEAVLEFITKNNLSDSYVINKPVLNKTHLKDKMIVLGDCAYLNIDNQDVKIDGVNIINQEPKFEVK